MSGSLGTTREPILEIGRNNHAVASIDGLDAGGRGDGSPPDGGRDPGATKHREGRVVGRAQKSNGTPGTGQVSGGAAPLRESARPGSPSLRPGGRKHGRY